LSAETWSHDQAYEFSVVAPLLVKVYGISWGLTLAALDYCLLVATQFQKPGYVIGRRIGF